MGTAILLSLGFSFFFSGIEMAFLVSNKLHIELQRKQGKWQGILLARFIKNPSYFLASILLGNTISLVIYSYYMTVFLDPLCREFLPDAWHDTAFPLLFESLVSTFIVLVFAEFFPKNLFMLMPNFLLSLLILPTVLIYYLLLPLVHVTVQFSKFFVTRFFHLKYQRDKLVFNSVDFGHYVENLGVPDEKQRQERLNTRILNNALGFKHIKVRDCMVPRTEITSVDMQDGIGTLKKAFIETGHSRVLVHEKTIDNVVGYCHASAIFHCQANVSNYPEIIEIPITPETTLTSDFILYLLKEKKSIALVVDEYGGTSGIITVEDIIEEIFGEIKDEHDNDTQIARKISNEEYLLSARTEIDYLNERFKLELPVGEYETLGGLIISASERIPQEGEIVSLSHWNVHILSVEENRVGQVRLVAKPATVD